ncbi:MAG TPA: alpha/beta family hydrolase [Actinomycetota bacterium]|nr:alpha/beta family hydrolase [Actinomycetota bacterium]
MTRSVRFDWDKGTVEGLVDEASGARARLVLGHGAGAGMSHPFMAAVAEKLAARGIEVVRFNFPYMQSGRKSPGPAAEAESCFTSVLESLADGLPTFAGGKSYGGRMASHVAASGAPMEGLVFLGYPLHPPGRTDKIRDAHLESVPVPMLFVQGTKDTFAQPDLLRRVLSRLPTATLMEVGGGDHSFKVGRRPASEVLDEVCDGVAAFADKALGDGVRGA